MAFLKAMICLAAITAVVELGTGLYAILDARHDHDRREAIMGAGLILWALIQTGLILACAWGIQNGIIA